MKVYKSFLTIFLSFLFLSLCFSSIKASCHGYVKCENIDQYDHCQLPSVGGYYTVACNYDSSNSCTGVCKNPSCLISESCNEVSDGGGGTATPTLASACSCQDVVNSGTYADNCPDDMIGTSCTTDPKTHKRTCNCYTTTHVCNPPGCDEVVSPPSCNISMSYSTIQFSIGSSASLQANVDSVANGSISEIDFTTSNSSAVG